MIERASTCDLADLVALETHFDVPWSHASWRAEIDGPGRLVLLARIDGQTAGAACFQAVDEVCDLHRIVVAPHWRGRGVARELLGQGMAWSAAQGARAMLLEVAHTNAAALRLYRGFGFAEVARRRDYYGPGADALVLEAQLDEKEVAR